MRIDSQSAVNAYEQRDLKSRDVKSKEDRDKKEVDDLKRKGVKQYTLDDFSPRKASPSEDKVDIGAPTVGSSLELTAQQILDKINESIKKDFPDYVGSTAPEDNTSEKISNNIVTGATALFGIYAAQNKDLQGEELISSFMKTIRGGVEKGYNQAKNILGEIGALKVSGVEDAISETMRLVEVGFKNFEDQYRKDNGLISISEAPSSEQLSQPEVAPSQA